MVYKGWRNKDERKKLGDTRGGKKDKGTKSREKDGRATDEGKKMREKRRGDKSEASNFKEDWQILKGWAGVLYSELWRP